MTESGGGRSDRLVCEDEFEEAFARLTAPTVEASPPDLTCRPGAPPPAIQTSAASAPTTSAVERPLPETPESAVAEALPETPTGAPVETPAGPTHDAPAQDEGRAGGVEGVRSMERAFEAAFPSGKGVRPTPPGEGLRLLFSSPQAPPDRPSLEEPLATSEHSSYYQVFVRNVTLRGRVLSSGHGRLDGLLEGGFRPGLYILSGHRPGIRRAFQDNLMWGAVEQRRPICCHALDTGAQAVWERMIVMLGSLLGEPVLPAELRTSTGVDDVAVRVGWIDAVLVRNVLPYVQLRDSVDVDAARPHRFMAALDAWLLHEGGPRLLTIDSPARFFPLLDGGTAQAVRLAGELDHLLRRRSSTAVATVPADPDAKLLDVVQGHLCLGEFEGPEDATTEIVSMTAHEGGRVKSEVFAVDAMTGLFG